jgi:DNA topoisomerase-2
MAQDFAGSNNLNYLIPEGQFGSRLSPDAAAPRYIFTKLHSNFRTIFKKEDDILLEQQESEGQLIEPKYYIPILPNVLINGAKGIGSGYATHIPKYNQSDIKECILDILKRKDPVEPIPWYRNFKGTVARNGNQVIITGCYEIINTTKIRIYELPIGTYLDDYKNHLFKLQDQGIIKDFDNLSTEESFEFIINAPRTATSMDHETILTKFKLVSKMTPNFTLWTEENNIKVFDNALDIIYHFVEFRLEKYEERRLKQIAIFTKELNWLLEKLKFIEYYIENSKKIAGLNKKELVSLLNEYGFVEIDRLLDIKIYNLTKDDIEKLKKQIEKVQNEIDLLNKTNCIKMYTKELNGLNL